MLQLGYRQIAALLLGMAISLTSLGFVYNWHSQFSDFQSQMTVDRHLQQTTAVPSVSRAEAHMALTYCANQLVKQSSHLFSDALVDINTSDNADSLIFYDGEQAIGIEQFLDNDVTQHNQYHLRHHQARQFELEVSHD